MCCDTNHDQGESFQMATVPQVARAMQTVLTTVADAAARTTGFVQRASKLTGAVFSQTLVFGWLANPDATLEELTQTAATLGVAISPQGLDQRFTRQAADCLKQVLDAAVQTVITAQAMAVPVLQRFNGVFLQDSSIITLPAALAEVWRGSGGSASPAGLKLQVQLNYVTGALPGLVLQHGRAQDRNAPTQTLPLPEGALRLADLGYFSLTVLADLAAQHVFWLSRLQAGTLVFDAAGRRWDLLALLWAQAADCVDLPVTLGMRHRLAARLLAVRVPQEVADQRRRRLRDDARHKGQTISHARLALADWTVLITNVPAERLSLDEALVLTRVRWQIELLFKLWKDHGHVDQSRSEKPWRILCEVYAKLLAMVVQHWLLLVNCWCRPDRSLRKAAQTVHNHALHLASAFGCTQALEAAIDTLQRCLAVGCRINKRKTILHTYQLLLALPEEGLA